MPKLLFIPLNQIRLNKAALRDVDRTGEGFLELVGSVKSDGITNAVSVREKPGEDGMQFELVDGLQRFSAATEAGTGVVEMKKGADGTSEKIPLYAQVDGKTVMDATGKPVGLIPAQVIERDEADALVTQIVANAHRIETKPVEYAKAVVRLLGYNPSWTITETAARLNKSPEWVTKQMGLLKLHDELKPLVDEGKIILNNAYALAKLPKEEQLNWKERAQTESAEVFVSAATERKKAIDKANRTGQDAGEEKFVPVAFLRKKPELEQEMNRPEIGPALIKDLEILKDLKASPEGLREAAARGFKTGIQWALNFDAKSIEVSKAKYEERKQKEEEGKIRRDAEKKSAKAKEAAEKAEKARKDEEEAKAKAAALPPAPEPVPA